MAHILTSTDLLDQTQALIGKHLAEVEEVYAAELSSENEYVRDIYAHTSRFRGKRLRPILCLLSAAATGEIRPEHATIAAVIEMIHTATLVHDDVLDSADKRRHVATVNVRWNNETSVLYGDFLFTHSFHLCASTGSAEACRIIGRATNRVCEGELTQIRNRGNLNLTEEEYYSIIDGKTAELSAVSCELAARFSNASNDVVQNMEAYGRKLGQAFQIADDVLDIVGLEGEVGKTLGTDIEQGKLTLPLIRLLQQTEGETHQRVVHLLENPSAEHHRELAQLCRTTGTLEQSIVQAHELSKQACRHLDTIPDSPARQLLITIATLAIDRSC